MKLQITIEKHELKTLVRKHLAKQNIIVASDEDILFTSDNDVVVSVQGKLEDDEPVMPPPMPPVVLPPPPQMTPLEPPMPGPPLGVVDGGQQPVDLTDVLGASRNLTRQKPGLYEQGERRLMEGESHEFPGAPKR